jgi:hypothetical protein
VSNVVRRQSLQYAVSVNGDAIRSIRAHFLTMLVGPAMLCGCATIRVESAAQMVRVERYWGVLAVSVDEPSKSHVAEVTSLGLARSPFGWSVGYSHQSWAALQSDCRLVIWVSAPEHLSAARELADPKTGVCVIAPSINEQLEVKSDGSEN